MSSGDTRTLAILAIFGVVGIGIAISLLLALPVMLLWNWLMPELFGLSAIGFWQAAGLMLLSSFLFKASSSSSSSSK